MKSRWEDYVIASDQAGNELSDMWLAGAEDGARTVWIMGVGFDPRSLVGLQLLLTVSLPGELEIWLIELPSPSPASDPQARALAADNVSAFESIIKNLEVKRIEYPSVHEPVNAGPRIAREATNPEMLQDVGQVILDISSLPSTIYFPMIASFLQASDLPSESEAYFEGEFQIVACENPAIDAAISEQGVSEAAVVGGFRSSLDMERSSGAADGATIWAPTIGENCGASLRAVHSFLAPDDTTPILPFPAHHPRRADRLLLEHQPELFEQFQITPANIIYADERNPYDVYRTLCRANREYQRALEHLGTTTLALSAHSSKLLSLGVLLAAHEHSLPIVAAPATDYSIDSSVQLDQVSRESTVVGSWLAGTPFS